MVGENKAWRCTLCGYVHRGETPPEYCPVCGASSSEFEPYEEPAIKQVQPASKRWRCLNCNYIHEGNSPPDMCPICGAGPDRFEPIPDLKDVEDETATSIKAVIVGGGIAGISAAEAIRKASAESSITLISSEPCIPYYRLNLTRYLAGEINYASLAIHPESWYKENRIDLIQGQKIVNLSADTRKVTLDNSRAIPYDKLILAMGSHPFTPPIPGIELNGVFTLRTASDADAILERIDSGLNCVCIGGGVLGLETAGALAKRGGNVTLLESHEWLMPRQLNKEAAALLESHITRLGIRLRKTACTRELSGTDGTVTDVILQDGEKISCGMVVICTGVRSNTHLARKAELEVNRGIVVDNYLTTSDPDILAAGDVSEHNGVVYGIWGPSQFQGTIAGLNALGSKTSFGGVPRSNALKVLGIDMFSIGQFTPEDGSYQVFHKQESGVFRYFVFHDGKMVGCILLGDAESTTQVKKAIEGRKDFSGLLSDHPSCADVTKYLHK
ncbi:FAD-dependent oxidoreductase [Verrucomicrobiota bacterium]